MELIKEIIEKLPIKCKKDCRCLTNTQSTCCKVVNCVDNKVHFVNYTSNCYCGYKMSFGNSVICNCPARKEIFNLKGV